MNTTQSLEALMADGKARNPEQAFRELKRMGVPAVMQHVRMAMGWLARAGQVVKAANGSFVAVRS